MKWKYYPLADADSKAKKQVLKNLEMGAYEHTLSKKLLSHFSEATGPIFLIAFESLDVDADCLYEYASYCGGKAELPGWKSIPWTDCPRWGLIHFVNDYLHASKQAIVLCENWMDTPTEYATQWRPRESRVVFYQEDVYHVLTSEDTDLDLIECTIRESEKHWATSVCSRCAEALIGNIPSEGCLDAIVANTVHIFTPALDGEGYLIWSPQPK